MKDDSGLEKDHYNKYARFWKRSWHQNRKKEIARADRNNEGKEVSR
jgi:hypothetical protein